MGLSFYKVYTTMIPVEETCPRATDNSKSRHICVNKPLVCAALHIIFTTESTAGQKPKNRFKLDTS